MTAVQKLSASERKAALSELALTKWRPVSGRDAIESTFLFPDFKTAFKFMSSFAPVADERDHHPEWFNVYNRVHVTYSTHDCGGLSAKDIEAAHMMDSLCEAIPGCKKQQMK
jgi:4a-hydroxytetrahydrobiopterin dehydratase